MTILSLQLYLLFHELWWTCGMLECICLLLLNVEKICILVCFMHLSMCYVKLFNFSIDFCSCSWSCFPVCLVVVASSSPVAGSGTLQSGIRAHVVAWAWMDHQDAVTEAGFLSAQKRLEMDDRKLPWICLSVWTVSSSEHLVERTSDVAEELEGSMPDGEQLEGKLQKKF